MPKHNPHFSNPYANHPEWLSGERSRLISRVPTSEYNFVTTISPRQGAQQVVINTLIKKLNDELRKRNITSFVDQDAFEDFIVRCELVLPEERLIDAARQRIDEKRDELNSGIPGSTPEVALPEAVRPDDGARATRIPTKNKVNAGHSSKVQVRGGSKRKPDGKG